MKLIDFDYSLPKDLIAQLPLSKREDSRLLVLDRKNGSIAHRKFYDIVRYLNSGDLLVLNDTKVILSRLFGRRKNTGGRIEALLLEKIDSRHFRALIKPLGRLKLNEEVAINNNGLSFKLVDFNRRIVEFNKPGVLNKLNSIGHVPLPHYIKRADNFQDRDRYQTVYARKEGAVAAPTAGLHFTRPLLREIRNKGVNIAFVTLHVGYGTFAPVKEQDVSSHKMQEEFFRIPLRTIKLVNKTKANLRKVFAVGTTTCRVLEANKGIITNPAKIKSDIKGYTDLFIHPPFKFDIVDALISNFHLPKSTLYMLVSAFAGLGNIKKAYQQAIDNQYRFFSYGDAMVMI